MGEFAWLPLLNFFLALLLAPLLPGVINRIKAKFGGRRGKPLLQLYFDLWRLLHKNAVYSQTTTFFFKIGPVVSLASILLALVLLPFGANHALLAFTGDFFLVAYFLALGRFALILAALDTGSSFEGMGASREACFSALAEPVFLLGLLALGFWAGSYSLSDMLGHIPMSAWEDKWPPLCILGFVFFLILLLENSRIPVDDPNTHLELTMIHEVMVLDHSGPDLAFIEYAAALKLWFYCSVVAGVISPAVAEPWLDFACTMAVLFGVAVLVGVVESSTARLRMERVPGLMALAGAFALLACLLMWR